MGLDKSMSNKKSTSTRQLAQDISKAFVKFLQNQTFSITDMKAMVEVEEIKTTAPLDANINTSVMYIDGTVPTPLTGTFKGVTIPRLNLLSQGGGDGSALETKGYAYIGKNAPDAAEANDEHNDTQVKLLEVTGE